MVNRTATQLVIWDWNGTLLDDAVLCCDIANTMREERGMPPLGGVDAYRRVFRFPIIAYYRAMGYTFETESYDDISVEFHWRYSELVPACPLYPEAKRALSAVQALGVPQLLLSVTEQSRLSWQAELAGVTGYFTSILGQKDDLAYGKADMARQVIAESGLDGRAVLFVGDTNHDAEIAADIGCRCALLTKGHQTRETLAACGVPLIESLLDVLPLLGEETDGADCDFAGDGEDAANRRARTRGILARVAPVVLHAGVR